MSSSKASLQARGRRFLDPLARLLLRAGFHPDVLTVAGLILSIAAGLAIAKGALVGAALLLLAGGLCDVLDGGIARLGQKASVHGAFLDSTLDRLAEIAVFLGLIAYYAQRPAMQIVAGLALTGSLMTSYARARAEGLRIDCKVGLLERPERLAILIAALLAAPLRAGGRSLLDPALIVLALLSYLTTAQRIVHVIRRSGEQARREEPAARERETARGA